MSSVWSIILEELRTAIRAALPTIPAEQIAFEVPPDATLGDLAVPCFAFAKMLHESPMAIAQRIAEQLTAHSLVQQAHVAGPYVNLVLTAGEVARRALVAVRDGGDRYGDTRAPSPERVMVEFISPNTNKPLHLGHLRNAALGESISRLLEAAGHEVIRVVLVNDRGIHIMKSMLAYSRWGNGATPESTGTKGDHFVGDWYVRFERERVAQRKELGLGDDQPTPLDTEAAEWLRRWEADDPELHRLWKQMNAWVEAGFAETYATLGIRFDRQYAESAIFERGKAIVAEQLAAGTFARDERGHTIVRLKDRFGLPDKVVQRADGTTVYATQDLALAEAKYADTHFDRSVVVVASEQDLYFQQLFAIFTVIGAPWAGKFHHRSYGMVMLPDGRMKSREGTVVDADDLIAELEAMAVEEIRSRQDAVPGEPDAGTAEPEPLVSTAAYVRAHDIALAALKFYLLLVTPEATVTFDPKSSLAFTGKTGPYLEYMHARCCAILRKASIAGSPPLSEGEAEGVKLLAHPAEKQLLLRIARFPDVVATAAETLDPSTLAQFLYDFAKVFADFYRDVPVLHATSDELRLARLALVDATRLVLSRGLTFLGITPLEEM